MVGAPLSSQWIAHKAASFTGCKLILSLSLFQNCTKHLISLPSTRWGQNWCCVCSGATRVSVDHSVALFLAAANVISSPWFPIRPRSKVATCNQSTNQPTTNIRIRLIRTVCRSLQVTHVHPSWLIHYSLIFGYLSG